MNDRKEITSFGIATLVPLTAHGVLATIMYCNATGTNCSAGESLSGPRPNDGFRLSLRTQIVSSTLGILAVLSSVAILQCHPSDALYRATWAVCIVFASSLQVRHTFCKLKSSLTGQASCYLERLICFIKEGKRLRAVQANIGDTRNLTSITGRSQANARLYSVQETYIQAFPLVLFFILSLIATIVRTAFQNKWPYSWLSWTTFGSILFVVQPLIQTSVDGTWARYRSWYLFSLGTLIIVLSNWLHNEPEARLVISIAFHIGIVLHRALFFAQMVYKTKTPFARRR